VTDAWPEALEDRLRLLVAQNMSAGEISKVLRVTRNAVIGKCDRLGLVLAGSRVAPSPPRRFSWEAPA